MIKPWTILIYANGNNDLEPEISHSLLAMERVGAGPNVNVLWQLARSKYELVQTLRPRHPGPTDVDGDWNGVRRYLIREEANLLADKEYRSDLLLDLGNINMAAPEALRDFITWAIDYYPAYHYMLILVGHGGGIIGALPDFTSGWPQIMSITGMNAAIKQAVRDTGRKIDVLVFDSCYMNTVEIIYELGFQSQSPGFMVAPEVTPLAGLPYNRIMKVLKTCHKEKPAVLVRKLTEEINTVLSKDHISLYAVRLNGVLLWSIKKIINSISKMVCSSISNYPEPSGEDYPYLSLNHLIKWTNQGGLAGKTLAWLLKKNIHFLTVPNTSYGLTYPLRIYLSSKADFESIKNYYVRFNFAKSNHWLKLLSSPMKFIDVPTDPLPVSDDMLIEGVFHIIKAQTPGISQERIEVILAKLGWSNCPCL